MPPKRALITGITGQDGSYLAELLLGKGYEVYGLVRRVSTDPFLRIADKHQKHIKFLFGNLRDSATIANALAEAKPDEIYNLAAQSDVGVSFKCPDETMETNYHGLGRLLHAAMKVNPKVRVYQASTSEMFGSTQPPQNEDAKFAPVSPYGEAKLKAHEDYVVGYRNKHNLFVCSGILFNHESPRRGINFVTRKITRSLAKVKLGLIDHFELGNLEAKRDWGYAGDYVEVMWRMLQQEKPADFVISSDRTHSVRDFVNAAAKALDMPITWEGSGLNEVAKNKEGRAIIKINPQFYRPNEVHSLRGDSSRARKVLAWQPKVSFGELVTMMAKHDLKDLEHENTRVV